jgi:two-component system sensor histidine kinase QseC
MSIRRYLVLTLISIIVLTTFVAAIQGYKNSMEQAGKFFDEDLQALANTLISLSSEQPLSSDHNQYVAYQLWQNNKLLLKTNNTPNNAISSFKQGFSEQNFNHQRWRVFSKLNVFTRNKQKIERWIFVAQPTQTRFALAEQLILSAVSPIIVIIPLLAIIIWLIVWQALKPLNNLALQLAQKKANDLTPVVLDNIPAELQTVEQKINSLFQRLSASFEREKHFASDAAHELRTPLSVLKINVHNLKKALGENNETLNHLSDSVDRMAHVVDQILLLNRTNPEQFSQQLIPVNIHTLSQEIISQLYPEIASRNQEIVLESDDVWVTGNDFALRILLQNLISNASKYTPNDGNIFVTISQNEKTINVVIEDSGPGIAESEREKVFNRFYRVGGDRHNSSIIGCGLGLAIVQHITILHNASITLSQSKKLGGLSVCVSFINPKPSTN